MVIFRPRLHFSSLLYLFTAELEKQKGVMRPSLLTGGVAGGGVGVKSDVVNGTLGRTSFDDNCSVGEGLKRTALSSSLRDLSETGKTTDGVNSISFLSADLNSVAEVLMVLLSILLRAVLLSH